MVIVTLLLCRLHHTQIRTKLSMQSNMHIETYVDRHRHRHICGRMFQVPHEQTLRKMCDFDFNYNWCYSSDKNDLKRRPSALSNLWTGTLNLNSSTVCSVGA